MQYHIALLLYIFAIYIGTGQMCNTQKARKLFFTFTCLGVILFQGFRSFTVGTDLAGYVPSFAAIGKLDLSSGLAYLNYEPGYVLLNKLLYLMGLDRRGFLIAVAVIVQIPIFLTLYRYSEMPLMSVMWYFAFGNFIMTFSGLRQSIAMALCFAAYHFIRKRKPVRYIVLVVFASLFHTSALFCLILYPLYFIKLNRRRILLAIGALAVVYVFRNQIFAFLSSIYYGEAVATRATGSYTMFITYVIMLLLAYFRSDDRDADFLGLRNVLLVLCMVFTFATLHDYATRIAYPLTLYMGIFIPKLVRNFDFVPKWLYHMICYAVLTGAFFFFLGGLDTLPFSFG